MKLVVLPRLILLKKYYFELLVRLSINETKGVLFFKVITLLPSLKQIGCDLDEKSNELVNLCIALKLRKTKNS